MAELSEDLDRFIGRILTEREHVIAARDKVPPELLVENRGDQRRDENTDPPYLSVGKQGGSRILGDSYIQNY
jgi:hypothetical protein